MIFRFLFFLFISLSVYFLSSFSKVKRTDYLSQSAIISFPGIEPNVIHFFSDVLLTFFFGLFENMTKPIKSDNTEIHLRSSNVKSDCTKIKLRRKTYHRILSQLITVSLPKFSNCISAPSNWWQFHCMRCCANFRVLLPVQT